MAASGKAPLAFGSSDNSYSVADQQNACLPPDDQVLPDATGLMSMSADPTTRLHANSKGRHEHERPQAPPASGRPLKERPTGTSVTRQANALNFKDLLNCRNSSEALSPGFPASLGEYCSSGIDPFWARLQTELLDRRRWHTRVELANAIFEYLEIFHNRAATPQRLGLAHPG
jgi:hypothetical protein